MAEFNYKLEDGKYTLYKDGKPLTNPHGIVITTDNEELAKKMEEALKKKITTMSLLSMISQIVLIMKR